MTGPIELPSGLRVADAASRLLRFCAEEYIYYDGLPTSDPNRVEPLDVLAAVSVNGFYGAHAALVRDVHRGLDTACHPLLAAIPAAADLADYGPGLEVVRALLDAAVRVPRVLVPVATKVLHRKRPNLVPMLDNVVLAHYLGTTPDRLPAATQVKEKAADIAVEALRLFRTDLDAAFAAVEAARAFVAEEGYPLTLVRTLEILVWTEIEVRGYYR